MVSRVIMCCVQVGLISLIFVSLLALILVLVMLTMLGLKRRCGKAEVYRPVYTCGEGGTSDMLYTGVQPSTQPLNISYIDLYSHCNPATGDSHKLMVASEVRLVRIFYRGLPMYKV